MSSRIFHFNGVNGSTGDYLVPPMTHEILSKIARKEPLDEKHLKELSWLRQRAQRKVYGLAEGLDSKDLSQTGWGVIFASDDPNVPALREALKELLDHRREQASRKNEKFYREFTGPDAYRRGETKEAFLARHRTGPGPAHPEKTPYYLLIVGDPETIPYRFQYQLDVAYAVGRIHFDSLEEYAAYAHSVVEAERSLKLPRRAVFFGVRNDSDAATNLSAEELVKPLSEMMKDDQQSWDVQTLLSADATKDRLTRLLGGDETPALLFTASHGMGFDNGSPRQLKHQGALLCQDWPGPLAWTKRIPEDFYFAADDVGDDARLYGLISFHFACYGAGTPKLDDFSHQAFTDPSLIAPHAFVASLPKRLLSHPKGGALAVIGHVERAWGYSFLWGDAAKQVRQLETFKSSLKRLMEGDTVGSAFEFFNERYAEIATDLSAALEEINFGADYDPLALAETWTAHGDARGYAIIGDPAIRLPVGDEKAAADERPTLSAVSYQPPGGAQAELKTPTPTASTTTATEQDSAIVTPSAFAATGLAGPTSAATHGPAVEFGLLSSSKDMLARLTGTLEQFAEKLSDAVRKALDDASSLEVSTFVADDMEDVKYEGGRFGGAAKLRAVTRISLDGDTQVCVPVEDGEIDEVLWKIHSETVQSAQANRAEMIKTLISAASGLFDVFKSF